ncbi:MAG: helix-turn-helix transcriptional regulator [Planctomycetes bacterium]|nr:helix-turn-helix transcriptional regulator [Planctomycetota bacterium]
MRSVFTKRYQRLLELLREARNDAELTQVDVSRKLKRHQSFVSKYEQGERRLDLVEFLEVADAIDVDPIKILKAVRAIK